MSNICIYCRNDTATGVLYICEEEENVETLRQNYGQIANPEM